MKKIDYEYLNIERLLEIIDNYKNKKIAVIGDFFVDHYMVLDSCLTEISLETNLEAWQVIEKRPELGGAGSVVNKLFHLGIGEIIPIGIMGMDDNYHNMKQSFEAINVDYSNMVFSHKVVTPTYIKPLMCNNDGSKKELNRLDIRNRFETPSDLENKIIEKICNIIPRVDGVIICDQENLPNSGTITRKIAQKLNDIAEENPLIHFWADSRTCIKDFNKISLKPNIFEACNAANIKHNNELSIEDAKNAGEFLYKNTQRDVLITMENKGLLIFENNEVQYVPAILINDKKIDIVGAGDSVISGLVASLAANASLVESALIGGIMASVTIEQIGTTGIAKPHQIHDRLKNLHNFDLSEME